MKKIVPVLKRIWILNSYLATTIAIVTKQDYKQVLFYINEAKNDTAMKEYLKESIKKSEFRAFADLEIAYGKRLGWYAFTRIIKPKIVIEKGIEKGLGAVILCSALLKNKEEGFDGRYFGTDIMKEAGYLLNGQYKEVGEILYGYSITSLSQLKCKIDLFINNSNYSADYEFREYETIAPLLNPNAIILGDNSHATDKLALFSIQTQINFLFFKEVPLNHWYPGGGIGISYVS